MGKNYEYLKSKRNYSIEGFLEDDDTEVIEELSACNEKIISIKRDVYVYPLNSRYDAYTVAKIWAESFEEVSPYTVFFIFGLANGMYLHALHELYPENIIIVYEPSPKIARLWLEREKDKKLFASQNIHVLTGKDGVDQMYNMYVWFITDGNYKIVQIKRAPSYENLWKEEEKQWYDNLNNYVGHVIVNTNTEIVFERKLTRALWTNMEDALNQYNLSDIMKAFEDSNVSEYPAILISAGPSLDKCVDTLKKVQGKVFMIAVDSALRTLERYGIRPHLTIAVDSEKRTDRFDKIPNLINVPMLLEITCNPDLVVKHKGKRFYFSTAVYYYRTLLKMVGKEDRLLTTGGSVANNAFSFLVGVGFKKIILVGQDLGYPKGKIHAEATYDDDAENDIGVIENELFEVEGNDGNVVLTESNMDVYRKWFETEIFRIKDISVYNTSENGAKINGAKVMSLENALKETMTEKCNIDFEKLIDSVPKTFSDEEKKLVKESVDNNIDRIKGHKRKFKEAILAFENMDRLKKRGLTNSKEFKKDLAKIKRINSWYSKLEDKGIIEMYEVKEATEIKQKALIVKKDEDEEWEDVIQTGIQEYKRMTKAVNAYVEDYTNIMKELKGESVC
ncbi:MAG: 6-hydroxymethylpterin diphosphokinase MptE-like protein [Agathobacter sp.]|nr:6-hydroxymethylpterin diphosphokinase MptE-like protein [Agathobacter sp.]